MDFPDVEGGMVAYLKTLPAVTVLLGNTGAVYFGVPTDADEDDYPLVTVVRVGGGQETGQEAPVDVSLVQLDVWGKLRMKRECWLVTAQVAKAVTLIGDTGVPTQLTAGVLGFGGEVESSLFLPDPGTLRPRYVLTATITALAG